MELNFGNLMGTHWEQEKNTKNPSLPTPSKINKNWTIHELVA